MKRLALLSPFAILMASCGTIEQSPETVTVENPAYKGHVISAAIAVPETKTGLGAEDNGVFPVVWSAGDEIAAISGKGTSEEKTSLYRLVGSGGTSTGTFEYVSGDADPAEIKDLVYPASAASDLSVPVSQTWHADSFDPAAAIMTWHSDEGLSSEITFNNIYSVVCLQITGEGSVTSVVAHLPEATYTLTCAEPLELSDAPQKFYIALPGNDEAVDIQFEIATSASGTMVKAPSAAKTFAAGTVVRFPAFAFEAATLYSVGDYYPDADDASTAEGIVFSVSDGGLHGLVISAREYRGAYGPQISENNLGNTAMREDPVDGKLATSTLISMHKDEAGFETNYPGFHWLLNTMNGGDVDGDWYVPTRVEIAELYCVMCGVDWATMSSEWKYYTDKISMPGYNDDSSISSLNAFKARLDACSNASPLNLSGKISSCYENAAGTQVWNFYFMYNENKDDEGVAHPTEGGQFRLNGKQESQNRIRPVKQF